MSGAMACGTFLGLPPPRPVVTAMYCFPPVANETVIAASAKNSGMPRLDLRIVGARFRGVHQEIHPYSMGIGRAQRMHQPGLHAAARHPADDMQNTFGVASHATCPADGHSPAHSDGSV